MIGQTDHCPCDTAPVTRQHLFQDCPLHDVVRWETWPKETSPGDKLFGDPEALQRTAAFIQMVGVSILHSKKKKYDTRCLCDLGHALVHRISDLTDWREVCWTPTSERGRRTGGVTGGRYAEHLPVSEAEGQEESLEGSMLNTYQWARQDRRSHWREVCWTPTSERGRRTGGVTGGRYAEHLPVTEAEGQEESLDGGMLNTYQWARQKDRRSHWTEVCWTPTSERGRRTGVTRGRYAEHLPANEAEGQEESLEGGMLNTYQRMRQKDRRSHWREVCWTPTSEWGRRTGGVTGGRYAEHPPVNEAEGQKSPDYRIEKKKRNSS